MLCGYVEVKISKTVTVLFFPVWPFVEGSVKPAVVREQGAEEYTSNSSFEKSA